MGKASKERKRRRLETERQSLLELTSSSGCGIHEFTTNSSKLPANADKLSTYEDAFSKVSDEHLAITISTLSRLAEAPDGLRDRRFKVLRKMLYDLWNASPIQAKTATGKVSEMISSFAWEQALIELRSMRNRGEIPKLGSVQRWVRECDAAGTSDPLALRVLDAILRTASPEMVADKLITTSEFEVLTDGCIRRYTEFLAAPKCTVGENLEDDGVRKVTEDIRAKYKQHFRICGFEQAANRKPPNKYDLKISVSSNELKILQELNSMECERIKKVHVPNVPGAFLLTDVLSKSERQGFIEAAETAEYSPDEPVARQPGDSILAHACVWLMDERNSNELFNRVKRFLPAFSAHGGEPLGINRRWRFYRYVKQRYYRPHIDGAWPASGVSEKDEYIFDVSGGSQTSRLTFLIYLCDDFEGGWTTFFVPSESEGVLNAFPVTPVSGCILVFPHGDTRGSLLHEGSPVLSRAKYVVRTDVLYKNQM